MFKALADPARVKIMSMLLNADEVCACDFSTGTSATTSHHLKLLREAGLVTSDKRGTWVYYRAVPERLLRPGRPRSGPLSAARNLQPLRPARQSASRRVHALGPALPRASLAVRPRRVGPTGAALLFVPPRANWVRPFRPPLGYLESIGRVSSPTEHRMDGCLPAGQ